MKPKTIGIVLTIIASLMWALEAIFAKLSFQSSTITQTTVIRAAIIITITLSYAFFTGAKTVKVKKQELGWLLYVAIAGSLMADVIYLFALAHINSINAVLIAHLQPIFIVLISTYVMHVEHLTKEDYFGILLMMIAAFLVTTKSIENLFALQFGTIWDLAVLFGAIVWATTTIVVRLKLKDVNAGLIGFYRFSVVFIVMGTYLVLSKDFGGFNYYQILLGIASGLGTVFYFEGLKRIKAAASGSLELTSTVFAPLIAFFVLGETTTIMQIAGIAILFGGIYFLSKREE